MQHTKPCKECPFRRKSLSGYLGNNEPREFAIAANHDGNFPCHMTMGKKREAQCAGRATMWANQCKSSRDSSVPDLEPDKDNVFSHIGEFNKYHGIQITPMQLMGLDPL